MQGEITTFWTLSLAGKHESNELPDTLHAQYFSPLLNAYKIYIGSYNLLTIQKLRLSGMSNLQKDGNQ
jgi:hypothetical protein